MFFEIAESGLKLGVQLLLPHSADHAAAGAVAAVAGATVGDEEKHAIRIAVHQPRHRHVGILTAGIAHLVGIIPRLLDAWDDLPPDGAVRIGGVDEVEEVRRDGHGQLVAAEQNAGALFVAERKVLFQSRERGHTVLELPCVAVPVSLGNIFVLPVARGVTAESFLGEPSGGHGVMRADASEKCVRCQCRSGRRFFGLVKDSRAQSFRQDGLRCGTNVSA